MSLKEFKSKTIRAGGNAKTVKGDDTYQTAIMYLAPHNAAFGGGLRGTVCPMAITAGCVDGCLFTAGRAAFTPSINPARIAKTRRYLSNRGSFMCELVHDLDLFVAHCKRLGVKPACRLNGTSDIQWEVGHPCVRDMGTKRCPNPVLFASIFEAFPTVQFYDYTKIVKRVRRALPANYSLVLSYSAANADYADSVLDAASDTGANVAIVYRTKALRDAFIAEGAHSLGRVGFGLRAMKREVIDGDQTDMRFMDPQGVIVGLYAKGSAKRDTSGFVLG